MAGDSAAHVSADAINVATSSRERKMMKRLRRMARARMKKRRALGLVATPVSLTDQAVRQRGFLQTMGFDVSMTALSLFDPNQYQPAQPPTAHSNQYQSLAVAGPLSETGLWSNVIWPVYQVKPGDPDYDSTANANPTATGSGNTPSPAGNSGDTAANPSFANDPNPRIVPVFEALLPDGKVLYWDWLISGYFHDPTAQMSTRVLLWDPMHPNDPGTRLDVAGANLFCAGYTHLPNGDLVLAGGNANENFEGLNQTWTFHWRTKLWQQGPPMSRYRWYPSVAALSNGDSLVVGGDPSNYPANGNAQQGGTPTPEVIHAHYSDPNGLQTNDASTDSVTQMTGMANAAWPPPSTRSYPFLVPSVDGRVLYAGTESDPLYLDANGTGNSEPTAPNAECGGLPMCFYRIFGSFAYYDTGKVLILGGGTNWKYTGCDATHVVGGVDGQCQPSTDASSEDQHGASSRVTAVDLVHAGGDDATQGLLTASEAWGMRYPRKFAYATVLPDGNVIATGGMSNTDPDTGMNPSDDNFGNSLVNLPDAVHEPEIWDAQTGYWNTTPDQPWTDHHQPTTLASASRTREYHSTAMLLPDGKVLTGGGGVCGACTTQGRHYYEPNFEIYSPPYLFKKNSDQPADQPQIPDSATITDGDAHVLPPVDYSDKFDVPYTIPGGNPIAKVSLLKLGAPTHSVDQGQRFVPLTFSDDAANNVLHVTAPPNSYEAPPGYYMLFMVDDQGVPSISRMIQVGAHLALNNISSVVSVFENSNFTGRTQNLGTGEFLAKRGNLANVGSRAISSVRVAPGYQFSACTDYVCAHCVKFLAGDHSLAGTDMDNGIVDSWVEPQNGADTCAEHVPPVTDPTPTPGQTPPPDPKPLAPSLKIAQKLKITKKLTFSVTCPSGCSVAPAYVIGKKKTALPVGKLAASGKPVTVVLALTKKQYAALKLAAKKKKKPTLQLVVIDSSKQSATASVGLK